MDAILKKWELLYKKPIDSSAKVEKIIQILLKNRGIDKLDDQKEFLKPKSPEDITLKELGISKKQVDSAIKKIESAISNKQKIVIYGDYDADGICATAILWETLFAYTKNIIPHIPDRFAEGYGINKQSVDELVKKHSDIGLIITVDNGIVANDAIDQIKKLGIDVIVTDHHQTADNLPNADAIVHTTAISGSAVAWVFAREWSKKFKGQESHKFDSLELACIGTVSDQLPLTGANRSIVLHGLHDLRNSNREGIKKLCEVSAIVQNEVGIYEVGFSIAPRINAMGRLKHGLVALQLLCTKDHARAAALAQEMELTNKDRQSIVEVVISHARGKVKKNTDEMILILSDTSYHEGVIGLAASKLVEEFYRPAIVIARGEKVSKASGRSISGFNMVEAIRKLDKYLIAGGGHPMAAGFSILTEDIEQFSQELMIIAKELIKKEHLVRKLRIDLTIMFSRVDWDFYHALEKLEPTGLGNPTATFLSENVEVLDSRLIGQTKTHLKLKLRQDGVIHDAIYFNGFQKFSQMQSKSSVDIVYTVENNVWNGSETLQLKIKDLQFCD